MKVRDKLLSLLTEAGGNYISGEEIARACGTSRTAVWKAVRALTEDGYRIDAVRNKGYALLSSSDVISAESILKYADDRDGFLAPMVYGEVTSTNDIAKELAARDCAKEGTLIVATSQTSGRGRGEHKFYSPDGSGLYMSLILRPKFPAAEAVRITTAAAVAVANAIDAVRALCPEAAFSPGSEAKIKWVNDIFLSGRKVCGILTEAALNVESGGLEYAVLGIGINVLPPKNGFPDDIANVAGALFSRPCDVRDIRSIIIGEVLKNFMILYADGAPHHSEYKRRSSLLGREIRVLAEPPYDAVAIDIDKNFHLIVRKRNGEIKSLSSGEVSVKGQ